jgi:hypothetical protein
MHTVLWTLYSRRLSYQTNAAVTIPQPHAFMFDEAQAGWNGLAIAFPDADHNQIDCVKHFNMDVQRRYE